jgi:hypothetical protein
VVPEDGAGPDFQLAAHLDGHPPVDDTASPKAQLGTSGDAEMVPEADLAVVAER